MKKKFKVGIVGCGRISKNHFNSINKNSDKFILHSICDVDQKILDEHIKKYKVKGYNNFNEMVKDPGLDIVSLCTPSGLHPAQTIQAAKNKINVITEKPMSTTWSDGLNMVDISKKHKVKLFVVKQNRFNKTLQLLKRAIKEKRFGKIHLVQVNVFWTRPQKYYDQGNGWRGTKKFDGGAFMNQASHYVDLLTWLIGPVKKIQAMTSKYRKIEVEDTGVVNIEWVNKTLGSMSVTMLTYPHNLEGSITILGEKGTVKVGGEAVNKFETWVFKDNKKYDKLVKKSNYKIKSVYGYGHINYYNNVYETLIKKAKPETDGMEGLKSLELLIAIYISAKKKKIVHLPLKRNYNI